MKRRIWGYLKCSCGGFPQLGLTDERMVHSVRCGKCGKQTDEYGLQTEAMDAWNEIAVQIKANEPRQLRMFI